MKTLMFSTDGEMFRAGAPVRERMALYGGLLDELHIVVFTERARGFREETFASNVFLYPTNSRFKFWRVLDGYAVSRRIIKRGGDWIIVAQDPFETGLLGYFLHSRFRVPLQIQIHTDLFSPYFGKESWKNRLRVLIADWLISRADVVRVVSMRVMASVTGRFGTNLRKIFLLPIFVDAERIREAPTTVDLHKIYPEYGNIILVASRLTREKNIGLAIRAMPAVLSKQPSTLLLIVGSGLEGERLIQEAGSLGLSGNIKFEPWQETLASYYKTADIYVLTSNYEGYGRSVVEAMAAGLPVVMTDVGIAGEIMKDGENGFIVPVGDASALAAKISLLLADRHLREDFRKNNLKFKLGTQEESLKIFKEILLATKTPVK